jgi:hypothetical protein
MNTEHDYFESNEDTIENFDRLNDKYRQNSDWINEGIKTTEEVSKEDLNPLIAFKSLYLPGENTIFEFETEYKEGESDPYQRILNLKAEIIDCKTKIDSHAEKFNNNDFIKESENVGKVLEELDMYKSRLDAFIDYNIFNKTLNDTSNDSKSSTSKQEFVSIFEKYTNLTENLIAQVKQNEMDILNNKFNDFHIKYEICSNPQFQMESLIERVGELEEMMNNLENNVGNWDIVSKGLTFSIIIMRIFLWH